MCVFVAGVVEDVDEADLELEGEVYGVQRPGGRRGDAAHGGHGRQQRQRGRHRRQRALVLAVRERWLRLDGLEREANGGRVR